MGLLTCEGRENCGQPVGWGSKENVFVILFFGHRPLDGSGPACSVGIYRYYFARVVFVCRSLLRTGQMTILFIDNLDLTCRF